MATEAEVKYESTCKCGQVKIELRGEPIVSLVCFCNDCSATTKYCDEKAAAANKQNISMEEKAGGQGLFGTSFWLAHMEFAKGEDRLVSFKTPNGKNVRTYSNCCMTCMICVGGKDFPYAGRGLNTNTLTVAKTGAKFAPSVIHRIMGALAPKEVWDLVPAPKSRYVSFSFLFTLLPKILFPWFFPGAGANKGRRTPGFYNSVTEVTEEVPLATYHALGRKLDLLDPKKLA